MLSKDELRNKAGANSRRYRIVPLPTGGEIRIRSITRGEQRRWRKTWRKKDGDIDRDKVEFMDDLMLAMCVVDGAGDLVFTQKEALDGIFDDFDGGDTNVMVAAVNRHNSMDGELHGTAIDDAVKNSGETPGNGSSGDSADDME
tara:strand:- start:2068 stop:2499 length:432 start_codon:yes stop_codon:yes gene_type:complete